MNGLLLDTTVLIDVLRGRPAQGRLMALRRTGAVPFVCAVNVDEVARGIRPAEVASARLLLTSLRLAPLTRQASWRAGRWRRDFSLRGVTLSQADCLVAAAALGVGARIATGNPRHFPMDEVDVMHWPVGG